jgi:hypothetical protein
MFSTWQVRPKDGVYAHIALVRLYIQASTVLTLIHLQALQGLFYVGQVRQRVAQLDAAYQKTASQYSSPEYGIICVRDVEKH